MSTNETQRVAYTLTEARTMLGISRATLFRMIADGRIRTVGSGKLRRVPADAIRDYLDTSLNETQAKPTEDVSPTETKPRDYADIAAREEKSKALQLWRSKSDEEMQRMRRGRPGGWRVLVGAQSMADQVRVLVEHSPELDLDHDHDGSLTLDVADDIDKLVGEAIRYLELYRQRARQVAENYYLDAGHVIEDGAA